MASPRSSQTLCGALLLLASALDLSGATGCKDPAKVSVQRAAEHTQSLVQLADKDVGEVRRGLPEGAARLAAELYAKGDPRQDLAGVRSALKRIRVEVADLNVAKSTFFALTDENGVAIRNDLEQDVMAGQNVVSIFPDLKKAIGGTFATATGEFPGSPGPSGPDRDWMAAAPVKKDDKVVGLLLTGWTYRRFANHLQQTLLHDLAEALRAAGDTGKLPILYVTLFDKAGVYGAPATPAVNEKALADADLIGKTASGPVQGTLNITDRDFGYAAARCPELGPDVGIAVLRSEI
jgi:hypothetical protein